MTPKYVLQFSGGRDSIATLLRWQEHKEETVVLWLDAGGTLPEVEAMIRQLTAGWNLHVVKSDAATWIRNNGLPADIVPTWRNGRGRMWAENTATIPIANSLTCCESNVMLPMHAATLLMHPQYIVRGQRNAEILKSIVRNEQVIDGITYLFPIQDWSDGEVNQYLADHGIELPEWYINGTKGFDCWWCTGFVKESRALHEYLRVHHPKKYQVLQRRFAAIEQSIKDELWFNVNESEE